MLAWQKTHPIVSPKQVDTVRRHSRCLQWHRQSSGHPLRVPQEGAVLVPDRLDLLGQVRVEVGRQQLVHVPAPEAPEVLARRRFVTEHLVDGAGAGDESLAFLELVCTLPFHLSARHSAVLGEEDVVGHAEVLACLRPAARLGLEALSRWQLLGVGGSSRTAEACARRERETPPHSCL